MNKKKFLSTALVVCIVLLIYGAVSASGVARKQNSEPEFITNAAKQSLNFVESLSIENPCISINAKDILSNEKSLDVYTDVNKNKYYFLKGTNTLCGYQKEYYYGVYTENPIPEEQAVRIAEEYLSRFVSEFSDYTLLFVQYSECDLVYQIQYSYYINGIPSDDFITIYIQANGEVGAFMMMNRGAYKGLAIDPKLTEKYLKDTSESNIVSQYITKTAEGVVLVQNKLEADAYNNQKINQVSISID
ncbi:MAG: hypothetical protein ACLSVG_01220 [Clostridia bacterium]